MSTYCDLIGLKSFFTKIPGSLHVYDLYAEILPDPNPLPSLAVGAWGLAHKTTVEPPNNGHNWDDCFCPLNRGCPLFRGY